MQIGASYQSAWDASPQLFVVGGSTAGRKALTTQFEQSQYDIACVEADHVADQMQSGLPAGVVFLEQRPETDFADLLLPDATDIPRIVVGTSIDSPDLYDAGVAEVIPFGIETHADAIGKQIRRILDRAHDCRFTQDFLDQTNHGIVVHHPETGEIITCNDQFYRMLGYDPATTTLSVADLVGHHDEFTEERAVEMVHRAAE